MNNQQINFIDVIDLENESNNNNNNNVFLSPSYQQQQKINDIIIVKKEKQQQGHDKSSSSMSIMDNSSSAINETKSINEEELSQSASQSLSDKEETSQAFRKGIHLELIAQQFELLDAKIEAARYLLEAIHTRFVNSFQNENKENCLMVFHRERHFLESACLQLLKEKMSKERLATGEHAVSLEHRKKFDELRTNWVKWDDFLRKSQLGRLSKEEVKALSVEEVNVQERKRKKRQEARLKAAEAAKSKSSKTKKSSSSLKKKQTGEEKEEEEEEEEVISSGIVSKAAFTIQNELETRGGSAKEKTSSSEIFTQKK